MAAVAMDVRSLEQLARLHVDSLPDSLIAALGERYVRSFYRYVAASPHEILAIQRGDRGEVVGAGVLSLEPATLPRRLLLGTPLALSAAARLPRLLARGAAFVRGARRRRAHGRDIPAVRPQLILIFTAERERGRGHGTALVRIIEERLRERGVDLYEARTEAEEWNRALDFYRNRGFTAEGVSVRFGTLFQVFIRSVGGPQGPQST